MEVAFSADWHIGLIVDSILEDNGKFSKENELRKVLRFISSYLIQNKIKHFIIGGDIFHNHKPTPDQYKILIEFLNWLDGKIYVYIIPGNHDKNSKLVSALTPLSEINWQTVNIIEELEAIEIEDVQFIFCPHIAKDELDSFSDIIDEINELARNSLKSVLVTHAVIPGCITGAERIFLHNNEMEFEKLENLKIILTGHIHKAQEFKFNKAKVIYPSSLIYNDITERKDKKGFVVLETTNLHYKYVETSELSRNYKVIKLNMVGKNKINISEEKIKSLVESKIVRIDVECTKKNKNQINIRDIEEMVQKYAFNILKTKYKVIDREEKIEKKFVKASPKEQIENFINENYKGDEDLLKINEELNQEVLA